MTGNWVFLIFFYYFLALVPRVSDTKNTQTFYGIHDCNVSQFGISSNVTFQESVSLRDNIRYRLLQYQTAMLRTILRNLLFRLSWRLRYPGIEFITSFISILSLANAVRWGYSGARQNYMERNKMNKLKCQILNVIFLKFVSKKRLEICESGEISLQNWNSKLFGNFETYSRKPCKTKMKSHFCFSPWKLWRNFFLFP